MTPQYCRRLPGSVRANYGGSVTPDSRIPFCNKATNALKMRPILAVSPYDKFHQNRTESHSHATCAAFDCPCGDLLASIAPFCRAWRLVGSDGTWPAAGACPARYSCDRHAWGTGMGAGFQPSDLRQSASTEGRAPDARRARHLRL